MAEDQTKPNALSSSQPGPAWGPGPGFLKGYSPMSEYENDMMKLIKQIAEDIRWLRQRAEERDRIKKQDDQELLERIEQTHRGPQKPE